MKVKQQHLGLLLVVVGAVLLLNSQGLLTMDITPSTYQILNNQAWTLTAPTTLVTVSKSFSVPDYSSATLHYTVKIPPGGITFSGDPRNVYCNMELYLEHTKLTARGDKLFQYFDSVGAEMSEQFGFTEHEHSTDITVYIAVGGSDITGSHGTVSAYLSYVPYISSLVASVSPSSATVNVGGSQTFIASASGGVSPYSFRWYVNDIDIFLQSSSYTVTGINAGTVKVKTECTDADHVTVWSSEAVLSVQNPAPPGSSSYVLTVGKSGSGTVSPTEGVHSYPVDSIVSLGAIADSGSSFLCWTVDGANVSGSSVNVTLNVDHAATAVFASNSQLLPDDNVTLPSDNQTLPNDQNQLPSGNEQASPTASPELLGELGLVLIGAVVFFASVKRKRGAG